LKINSFFILFFIFLSLLSLFFGAAGPKIFGAAGPKFFFGLFSRLEGYIKAHARAPKKRYCFRVFLKVFCATARENSLLFPNFLWKACATG
jgi:hypothetical protein